MKLQKDFNAVAEWLESMDLVCNMKKGKTEVMLFGTTQNKTKNTSLSIQYRFKKQAFINFKLQVPRSNPWPIFIARWAHKLCL